LKQPDQPSISTKPLQTGRAIRFQQYLRGTCRSRRKAGRRKSGCPTELVAGQAQGRDSPFLACSSDVATMEDSKPFAVRLLDLQRRERKGHGFRAAAAASGRSSEEPVAKPNAAATRRTFDVGDEVTPNATMTVGSSNPEEWRRRNGSGLQDRTNSASFNSSDGRPAICTPGPIEKHKVNGRNE